MNELRLRITALVISATFMTQLVATPGMARASILTGCVDTDDTAVPGKVGWVDVGVMLGSEAAQAPGLLTLVAPDGTTTNFIKGDGLIPPTDEMPIWFAPAELAGTYELIINGEERCTIVVNDGSDPLTPIADEIELDWRPQSAPVHQN